MTSVQQGDITTTVTASPRQIFNDYCQKGVLAYQVSTSGKPVFYPRLIAPGDASSLEWRESSGLGIVYASTTVRNRDAEPHNVSIIELDEGFRLMSSVRNVPAEDVTIGLRVAVRIDDLNGTPLPVFVPVTADQSPQEPQNV